MKVSLVFAAAALTLSATASAEHSFTPHIYNILVATCNHAQNDDRLGLHKTLKANRLSKQAAVDKVVCNGQPLVTFARNANADKVVDMLAPYERRSKVSISDVVAP
ncbi:DUF3718 domain-containing protein [Rheinheimera sp. 1928-s]|uniref:DUF3718 domain-containing protein n=1 Tax=Rheinheimera sp. 1928-s TaxID=3033803 RepID=UPI002625CF40|nr:DUF3718 domain-containing protein [Rheinheimera sp. 1928-s]MDF3124227.1 DUF3718 domain-containing protein [Rheinheimera sp. 1928-s]